MSNLKNKVIEAGMNIRNEGGCVDRLSLEKSLGQEDGQTLMKIWLEYIDTDEASQQHAEQLSTELQQQVSNWAKALVAKQNRVQTMLEQKLDSALVNSESMNKSVTNTQAQITILNDKLNLQTAEITRLSNQLNTKKSEAKSSLAKLEQAEKKIEDLEHELLSLQQETKDLDKVDTRKLIELQQQNQQALQEKEHALADANEQLAEQNTLNHQLHTQLTRLVDQYQELKDNYNIVSADANKDTDKYVAELTWQLTTLQQELEENKVILLHHQEVETKLQYKIKMHEQAVEETKSKLQDSINNQEKIQRAYNQLEQQYNALRTQTNAEQDNKAASAEVAKTSLIEQDVKTSANEELEQTKEKIAEQETLINQLKLLLEQSHGSAMNKQSVLEYEFKQQQQDAQDEIRFYAEKHQVYKREIETLKQTLASTDGKHQELELVISHLENKIAAKERQAELKNEELAELHQKLALINDNANVYSQENDLEIARLQGLVAELEQKVMTISFEKQQLLDKLAIPVEELQYSETRQADSLSRSSAQVDTHHLSLQTDLMLAKEKNEQLQNQLSELERNSHASNSSALDNYYEQKQQNDRLKKQFEDLKSSYDHLLEQQAQTKRLRQEDQAQVRVTITELKNEIDSLRRKGHQQEQANQDKLMDYKLKYEYAQKKLDNPVIN